MDEYAAAAKEFHTLVQRGERESEHSCAKHTVYIHRAEAEPRAYSSKGTLRLVDGVGRPTYLTTAL